MAALTIRLELRGNFGGTQPGQEGAFHSDLAQALVAAVQQTVAAKIGARRAQGYKVNAILGEIATVPTADRDADGTPIEALVLVDMVGKPAVQ